MGALDGLVVWITGGGSGIGRACALEFAQRGAAVAVSGRRADRLEAVTQEIQARGGSALAVPCDVADESALVSAVRLVVDWHGRLDICMANAGFSVSGRTESLLANDWRRQFEVNVVGLAATAAVALPHLRDSRGRLVLIGSVMSQLTAPGNGPYAASKAAVRAIGQTLHMELAGTGVSVCTIHPGFVESEIGQVDNTGRFDGQRKDPRPSALMWTSARAARVMVDATVRRKRELVFTGHGKLAYWLAQHLPGLVIWAQSIGPGRRRRKQLATVPDTGFVRFRGPQVHLSTQPGTSLGMTMARAARLALQRPEGQLPPVGMPQIVVRSPAPAVATLGELATYRAACGDEGGGEVLPLCWLETQCFAHITRLVLSPAFPLSPLGLIHLGQTIVQHRAVRVGEPVDLSVATTAIRRTSAGIELDLGLRGTVRGDRVWEATTRLISRRKGAKSPKKPDQDRFWTQRPTGEHLIQAHADTGRRYAKVSGDYAPHHLWSATALPFGYKRPIAHGMWSLAAALAEIQTAHPLPERLRIECRFMKPWLMPGDGRLQWTVKASDGISFGILPVQGKTPHLVGGIVGLDAEE